MDEVGLVAHSDHDAMLIAVAQVIARRGYWSTTLAEIAVEAGKSRRSIRYEIGDVEDCFFALLSWTFHRVHAQVTERTAGVPWPASVRDGLAAFLEILSSAPVIVQACVEGVRSLGAAGTLRIDVAVEAFTAFLTPGFERIDDEVIPELVPELIGMSVLHVVSRAAAEDRLDELPDALSSLVSIALAPFCAVEDIDALLAAR